MAWGDGQLRPIISPGMMDVLNEKLSLPRIARRFGLAEVDRRWIHRLLDDHAERVHVSSFELRNVTGDPEDRYVLATVRIGRANWLVMGDKGSLTLESYEGIRIISPRQCLGLLGLDAVAAS